MPAPSTAPRISPPAKATRNREGDRGPRVPGRFANRSDQHHAWAVELARQIHEPLLTCEAVLSEAAFHLGSAALVLQFVLDGMVKLDFDAGAHLARLEQLATRYADRRPDLADLCLIRMSELHRECPVITTDLADFRVYRRGRREAIPILHPPPRKR